MNVRTEPPVLIEAAAVDLGFFGTKFAWARDREGRICVGQFPSDAVPATRPSFPQQDLPDGFYLDVAGATYFVGPDVAQLGGVAGARRVQEGYIATPEYKAFLLGSLADIAHRCRATHVKIRCLSLGSPMSTFHRDQGAIKALAGGTHIIPAQPGGKPAITIEVLRVVVMPQPLGGLVALTERLRPTAMDERVLIVDVGGGTTDWYVSDDGKAWLDRCGSTPVGTLECARALCEAISPGSSNERALLADADHALTTNAKTVFIGGDHEVSKYLPAVESQLQRIVGALAKGVQGTLLEFRCVFLTGGGAQLLYPRLIERFPDRKNIILLDDEPVFSNVQGFYIVAEQQDAR